MALKSWKNVELSCEVCCGLSSQKPSELSKLWCSSSSFPWSQSFSLLSLLSLGAATVKSGYLLLWLVVVAAAHTHTWLEVLFWWWWWSPNKAHSRSVDLPKEPTEAAAAVVYLWLDAESLFAHHLALSVCCHAWPLSRRAKDDDYYFSLWITFFLSLFLSVVVVAPVRCSSRRCPLHLSSWLPRPQCQYLPTALERSGG